MKILSTQALRGPNYWSATHHKLIQIRIDIPSEEGIAWDTWKAWREIHSAYFPETEEVDQAPFSVPSAMARIALALQRAAGSDVNAWLVRPTIFDTISILLVEYAAERTGKRAVRCAVELTQALIRGGQPELTQAIKEVRESFEREQPSEAMQAHILEARMLGIPVITADKEDDLPFRVGYGKKGMDLIEGQLPESLQEAIPGSGRIPVIAITGSNGKTTTTRLIAHLLNSPGTTVGFTTSDGVYIGEKMVDQGDTTGPFSAQRVLRDSLVDLAVLETARGGIVRAGLGFDQCDIAVVTNVQEDHLGISDIETMDDLARVKSVIVRATKSDGYAILNADNPYTRAMAAEAPCKVAWFSMDNHNPLVVESIANATPVVYIEDEVIYVHRENSKIQIASLENVPITFNGRLAFMTQNALAATLAAALYGADPANIAEGLSSFYPSLGQTPGRMNIYDVRDRKVLVDFAHNPDGFIGIRDFLSEIESPLKIGIIVGTGDRKESDVRELGQLSAEMFDHVLIHQVKFLRGKTAEQLVNLLVEGMHSVKPDIVWERVPDAIEPLGYALSIAPKDGYITALSDVLEEPPRLIEMYS